MTATTELLAARRLEAQLDRLFALWQSWPLLTRIEWAANHGCSIFAARHAMPPYTEQPIRFGPF